MIKIKKIKTGRNVRTTVYRAYKDGKVIKYKGMIISSDTIAGLRKKINYLR